MVKNSPTKNPTQPHCAFTQANMLTAENFKRSIGPKIGTDVVRECHCRNFSYCLMWTNELVFKCPVGIVSCVIPYDSLIGRVLTPSTSVKLSGYVPT